MLAARLIEAERIELADVALPDLGAHDARVNVREAGICSTDLAIHSGAYPVPLPLTLGHEWVGEVMEVGAKADASLVGQTVVGEINNTCAVCGVQACSMCATGASSHCLTRTVTGIIAHDGAFAEQLVVPAGVLHVVPEECEDLAVLTEPLAAAIQTFACPGLDVEGRRVVVLGAGRLGTLIAYVAHARGADVVAVARSDRRQRLFDSLGVELFTHDLSARTPPTDPLAPAPSPLLDRVLEVTDGRGADIVVEATGTDAGLHTALDLVRPQGAVCLKSTPGIAVDGLNATRLVVNEVTIFGSRCGPFDEALRFLAEHRDVLLRLPRTRYPLSEIDEALDAARYKLKVLVAPDGPTGPMDRSSTALKSDRSHTARLGLGPTTSAPASAG